MRPLTRLPSLLGDFPGDYAEVRRAGVRIKCKHHSLEVSEDDIVLSLNEPGGGAELACGAAVGVGGESGRGSSTSLRHLLERDESGEIVILTPSKITIENYPMMVRVPKTAPTTPEYHRRHNKREVIVSPLPDYATAPSPIHWHFPCSDSDGTGTSGGGTGGASEDTTTSTSTDESHTVIQNYRKTEAGSGGGGGGGARGRSGTKTVSIWRTSENSDEEASAMIFHHESGTVENYSGNSSRSYIRLEEPATELKKEPLVETFFGPLLNNAIGTPRNAGEDTLKMSHNNAFPTLSSVHDLSNEIRRFQKTSNFEPWTSNNLLSTVERNQSRRHRDEESVISSIEMETMAHARSGSWNNGRRSSDNHHLTTELPSYSPEDRFDLTSRLESFVRRFNKPSSIALTTLNRLSPTATGHLNTTGTGGRIRNRFGGIERRRRRRKHQRSQIATIRRLLGGISGSAEDDHPHLLQTELDWINEDLMRTQAEHREGRRRNLMEVYADGGEGGSSGRGGDGGGIGQVGSGGLMTNIRRRVKRTINLFKRS